MNEKGLVGIVCGMPFSGTTYLSRMIASHPLINTGFECGLLLRDSPQKFSETGRYYNWMMDQNPPHNWNLSTSDMELISKQETFHEAYEKIVEHCHLFDQEVRYIVDKTPSYVYDLKNIMMRVPNVPVFVVQKDPLHQFYSFKKREKSYDFFVNRMVRFRNSMSEVVSDSNLNKRLVVIDFRTMLQERGKTYRKCIQRINQWNGNLIFESLQVNDMNLILRKNTQEKMKLRKKYDFELEMRTMNSSLSVEEKSLIINRFG